MHLHQDTPMSSPRRLNRSGLRKVTPGLKQSEVLAARYSEAEPVTKALVWRVVAEAAAPLGLSASAQIILNLLFKRSKPSDWGDLAHHPIVWPSNDELCRQSGLSLPTVQRSLRALVNTGLIAYADSNNCKRRGFRDQNGTLTKAFGFDLAPSAVRYTELKAMIERIRIEDRIRYDYREDITIQRRSIRATIEAARTEELKGDWLALAERYSEITDGLRTAKMVLTDLQAVLNQLFGLRRAVDKAWELATSANNDTAFIVSKAMGLGIKIDHHSTDYNRDQISNQYSNRRVACAPPVYFAADGSEEHTKKEGGRDQSLNTDSERGRKTEIRPISLELLATACPNYRDYKPFLKDWEDVLTIAESALPALGINRSAWIDACQAMGRYQAAISVVIILEKMSREPFGIKSPGGYLRAMTERFNQGQLNLIGSLMGLAKNEVEMKLN